MGAYVVQGERNDTHTMMDTAVYDTSSRKMLFRDPGIGRVKGSATPTSLVYVNLLGSWFTSDTFPLRVSPSEILADGFSVEKSVPAE